MLHKNFLCTIIFVYLSTNDENRNKSLEAEINNILNRTENTPTILLGDFNGHVGFLEQKLNKNGKRIIDWISETNLTLLNGDTKCSGVTTWENLNYKSAVDFILVNTNMYDVYMNGD